MSADNGIYIGWFGEKEFRVIHAQAIDNVFYPSGENAESIVDYFGGGAVFDNLDAAQKKAFALEEEIMSDDFCPILEYGISTLKFSKTFDEYVKEADEQKKFNQAMNGEKGLDKD